MMDHHNSIPEPASNQPQATPRDRVIDAMLVLAKEQPWSDIGIAEIARQAGISLAEMRGLFPSKGAVLGAFAKRIDGVVLEDVGGDWTDESPRDRLFDVLMQRFDALTPYKPALKRIAETVRYEPLTLAALNGTALNAHRFMLAAAGISTDDALGALKLQGAALVFARTLDTWFLDDSPDLSKTMMRLDTELDRGETALRWASKACDLKASLFRGFQRSRQTI